MFSDPVKNLKMLGLRENDIVADLGAGTGFYSLAVASMVPKGKVYAIEIVRDYLTTIKNKVKDAHLNNVEIIWGNIEQHGGTKIGDGIADAVIASNVFSQVEDKDKFIEEVKRILKSQGKVLLVDWTPDSLGISPKTSVSKSKTSEMFKEKNFRVEKDIDAGAHHYGMILVRQ